MESSAGGEPLDATGHRVALIAGARPNFMKVKPVLDAFDAVGAESILVHTGQHYDSLMSDIFFEELGLRRPDIHLGAGSGSHAEQTARVMVSFEGVLDEIAAHTVVVVGDVNSTLACSIVAAKAGVPVAHVEAGLRSNDWAMPEEVNRVLTDRIARWLLAPSEDAVENLRREGEPDEEIFLVGNVMVDTLLANLDRARSRRPAEALALRAGAQEYGLVTLHRPATVDTDEVLFPLIQALAALSGELPLIFPVHPRTRARLGDLDLPASLRLAEPAGYLDFIALEAGARVVITDSGGVQEETTVLGVPCLTVRENTERPITISQGTNRLVGLDPAALVRAFNDVLARPPEPRCPELWDGRCAERVVRAILAAGSA